MKQQTLAGSGFAKHRKMTRREQFLQQMDHETTICKFCHLLEQSELGAAIFDEINAHLADQGIQVSGGTMVDAAISDAPGSTRNESGERDPDPEMHQTRKGNQWYFGMKGHLASTAEPN